MQTRRTTRWTRWLGVLALLLVTAGRPTPAGAQVMAPLFVEVTGATVAVNGSYIPIVGEFRGADGLDDILWYAPGSGAESLWVATGDPADPFDHRSAPSVTGTYTPVVADMDGNGLDDIIWYAPGTAPDARWMTVGTSFVRSALTINGTFRPVVLDNLMLPDSIFWHAPGAATDWLWSFAANGTYSSGAYQVSGTFKPVSGDFDSNGWGDIFWYAPGSAADSRWARTSGGAKGAFTSTPESINGTYTPLVGQFHDPSSAYLGVRPDIAWTTPTGVDWTWEPASVGWDKRVVAVGGVRAVHLPGDYGDGIITIGSGGADQLWRGGTTGPGTNERTDQSPVASDAIAVVGTFTDTHQSSVLWYRPGAAAERFWSLYEAP